MTELSWSPVLATGIALIAALAICWAVNLVERTFDAYRDDDE